MKRFFFKKKRIIELMIQKKREQKEKIPRSINFGAIIESPVPFEGRIIQEQLFDVPQRLSYTLDPNTYYSFHITGGGGGGGCGLVGVGTQGGGGGAGSFTYAVLAMYYVPTTILMGIGKGGEGAPIDPAQPEAGQQGGHSFIEFPTYGDRRSMGGSGGYIQGGPEGYDVYASSNGGGAGGGGGGAVTKTLSGYQQLPPGVGGNIPGSQHLVPNYSGSGRNGGKGRSCPLVLYGRGASHPNDTKIVAGGGGAGGGINGGKGQSVNLYGGVPGISAAGNGLRGGGGGGGCGCLGPDHVQTRKGGKGGDGYIIIRKFIPIV